MRIKLEYMLISFLYLEKKLYFMTLFRDGPGISKMSGEALKMSHELDGPIKGKSDTNFDLVLTLLMTILMLHIKLNLRPHCSLIQFMTSFMIAWSLRMLHFVGRPISCFKRLSYCFFLYSKFRYSKPIFFLYSKPTIV